MRPSPSSSSNAVSTTRKAKDTHGFSDTSETASVARKTYLKIYVVGTFSIIVVIFAVFSIFWGALWKIPSRNLPGWVVDFDGGLIGRNVAQALTTPNSLSAITWTVVSPSQFPGGPADVGAAVLDEQTWVAITINEGSTARLKNSLVTPNATYDGSEAMTVFGVEARNENAFRNLIWPSAQTSLDAISAMVAIQLAKAVANETNLPAILANSPQSITAPLSYQLQNLAPFDIPLAIAVTFVGLIYQLILSFFIVMVGFGAREASGFDKSLHIRSLIALRLISSFGAYLFISLFYSLLSVAFQLPLNNRFGNTGFLLFWMLNYAGMLACGLALESLITLLTAKGIPFFMIMWIITNVSVCSFPMEVMPKIFNYGHAAPFFNVSRAMRTIIFGTKNRVGISFGVLIVWIFISCVTLPIFQWIVRRRRVPLPQVTDSSHENDEIEVEEIQEKNTA